jgi:signal transduction histidine kinase
VDATPGQGTRVEVTLPLLAVVAAQAVDVPGE